MQEKFTALFQIDGFAFHNRHPVYKLRLNGYAYIGAEASRTYLLVAFLVTYLPIYLFTYYLLRVGVFDKRHAIFYRPLN